MISDNIHGKAEPLTVEQLLTDSLYAACPQMSRDQIHSIIGKQVKSNEQIQQKEEGLKMKTESKMKLRKARDLTMLEKAVEVCRVYVTRENKRTDRGLAVPVINSLRTFTQGNYTVVLLNDEYIGVSKRMKKDKFNWSTGVNKALYRAVRRLVLSSR